MRKMFTRLYEWLWHPSCRRDAQDYHYKGKASLYRYPSPGNIIEAKAPQDYKTPFQQTHYNVRYVRATSNQRAEKISRFSTSPVKVDPIKKLILTHLLKEADKNDAAKIAEAKLKFKEAYGYECEKEVTYKDFPVPHLNSADRESVKKNYEKGMMELGIQRGYEKDDLEEWTNRPDYLQFQSLDLYDAPHLQQGRVENAYTLDHIIDTRAASGVDGLQVREGSANFWKALDDSNDAHEIAKVQSKIGDDRPTDFSIPHAKVKFEFDKNGNVVDMHRIAPK